MTAHADPAAAGGTPASRPTVELGSSNLRTASERRTNECVPRFRGADAGQSARATDAAGRMEASHGRAAAKCDERTRFIRYPVTLSTEICGEKTSRRWADNALSAIPSVEYFIGRTIVFRWDVEPESLWPPLHLLPWLLTQLRLPHPVQRLPEIEGNHQLKLPLLPFGDWPQNFRLQFLI